MNSLTTLLATATVAAAYGKVEEVAAPGILPDWLGGPVLQVFDKGLETVGVALGWATGAPHVVADVITWGADTAVSVTATARDVVTGDADTLDTLADLALTIGSIVFVIYVVLTAINLFLATLEAVRDYLAKCGLLTIPRVPAMVPLLGVEIKDEVVSVLNTPIDLVQKYIVDPVKNYQHRTIIPLEGDHRDGGVGDGRLHVPRGDAGPPRVAEKRRRQDLGRGDRLDARHGARPEVRGRAGVSALRRRAPRGHKAARDQVCGARRILPPPPPLPRRVRTLGVS